MRSTVAATAVAVFVVLPGCAKEDKLSLDSLPLAHSVRIQAQRYECPVLPDQCFRYAILVAPSGTTSAELKTAERRTVAAHGWHFTKGVTHRHVAADSPDGKLFVSFATGAEELARGRLHWSEELGPELRRLVAAGGPVLAVALEPEASR